jgi:uracil-DNA glycosylase
VLLGCYHPSRQNTNTGKLTAPMMRAVFLRARALLEAGDSFSPFPPSSDPPR